MGRQVGRQVRRVCAAPIVHSDIRHTNTGEFIEFYGHVARRILTNKRETQESRLLSESVSDGWYIDPPATWLDLHPSPGSSILYYISGKQHKEISEVGQRPDGFAMSLSRVDRFFTYNGPEPSPVARRDDV